MINENQKSVLQRIATEFSNHELTWALGGPVLLGIQGVFDAVEPIGIMITSQGVKKADEILCDMGEKQPRIPASGYISQFFHVYIIDGVQFSLICGMAVRNKGYLFSYNFNKDAIVNMAKIGDVYVPCTSLEDWWILYQMIPHREDLFDIIDRYFHSNGMVYQNRFQIMKTQPLPPSILVRIQRLYSLASRVPMPTM